DGAAGSGAEPQSVGLFFAARPCDPCPAAGRRADHCGDRRGHLDSLSPCETARVTVRMGPMLGGGRCVAGGRLDRFRGQALQLRLELLGVLSRATRSMASRLRSTSSSVVAQLLTLMRMAVRPCHTVPPHQQVPSFCKAVMTRRVRSASPKATST